MATTYTAEITSWQTRLRPFPLDGAFSLRIGPTSDSQTFTAAALDLFLTNANGSRLTLVTADATLSSGDTVITFSKDKAWVAANMVEGEYDVLFFVNDGFYLHLSFLAFVPTGGEVAP
jgi:hypothetical protein